MVDDTKAYLFEIFHDVKMVGQKETAMLRRTFGQFPATAATRACAGINRIVDWLTDRDVDQLMSLSRGAADGAPTVQEFGKNLKFVSQVEETDAELSTSDSEEEDEQGKREINLRYTGDPQASKLNSQLDSMWLQREVSKFFPNEETVLGMSLTSLCATIFDTLTSNKTDEALQNDVS